MTNNKIDFSLYHPSVSKIISLLEENSFWYKVFEHEAVKTSEEAAKIRTGYTLEQGAKAIILKTTLKNSDTKYVQAVLPGDKKIKSKKLSKITSSKSIRFANAEEINKLTDGIQIGGIPPFGNLFGITVYLDKTIQEFDKIIFNAGDRKVSVAMKTQDYVTLVDPSILSFSK